MQLYDENNWDQFLNLVPVIKHELAQWRLIHYHMHDLNGDTIEQAAEKICGALSLWPGAAFVYNKSEILMLAKTGEEFDKDIFCQLLEVHFPQYKCTVTTKDITWEGIARVEVVLGKHLFMPQAASDPSRLKTNLLDKRRTREHRKIMVVDDDSFTRSMIARTLRPHANIVELNDARGVVERYLLTIPDAVFLDINLPAESGLDVLAKLMDVDSTAYIVMISGEDISENIITARARGAQWFLPKPFTPEKLKLSLSKCETMKSLF